MMRNRILLYLVIGLQALGGMSGGLLMGAFAEGAAQKDPIADVPKLRLEFFVGEASSRNELIFPSNGEGYISTWPQGSAYYTFYIKNMNNHGEFQNEGSFEIYLVAEEMSETENVNIDDLSLEEEPILTMEDIEKYYWHEQCFVTRSGYRIDDDLVNRRLTVFGLPYVVVVNGERIYMGKLWTQVSSVWPYSPSITIQGSLIVINPEQYELLPGQRLYSVYWDTEEAKEAVFDERIYDVLEQNGLLAEILVFH